MSQNSQGAFGLATALAIGIFLVAFACLWTLGEFAFFPAAFLAAVIAAIVWIVLFIGFGRPEHDDAGAQAQSAPTAHAPDAAPAAAVATAASDDTSQAEEAAAQKQRAEAAERDAREKAKRGAEAAEAAEAKRQADEAAAKARADAEAAAAAQTNHSDNAAAATTPDYDGDGVREGTGEGTRPESLDAPRGGNADDLKQIKGIGAKMEALCNRLGFWHFDQIASWNADEVAWVDANLEGFKGRVSRDKWVEQASVLAGGGETEFSKRVEDGDVY